MNITSRTDGPLGSNAERTARSESIIRRSAPVRALSYRAARIGVFKHDLRMPLPVEGDRAHLTEHPQVTAYWETPDAED